MDRVNDNNEEDLDGLAAVFARQMKEVTLAALDRITKEMERLSESVQRVNEHQAHFESVLKLGPMPTEEQRIDLGIGEDSPLNEDGDAAMQYRSVQRSMCSQGGDGWWVRGASSPGFIDWCYGSVRGRCWTRYLFL